jgi:hypothetical protein
VQDLPVLHDAELLLGSGDAQAASPRQSAHVPAHGAHAECVVGPVRADFDALVAERGALHAPQSLDLRLCRCEGRLDCSEAAALDRPRGRHHPAILRARTALTSIMSRSESTAGRAEGWVNARPRRAQIASAALRPSAQAAMMLLARSRHRHPQDAVGLRPTRAPSTPRHPRGDASRRTRRETPARKLAHRDHDRIAGQNELASQDCDRHAPAVRPRLGQRVRMQRIGDDLAVSAENSTSAASSSRMLPSSSVPALLRPRAFPAGCGGRESWPERR